MKRLAIAALLAALPQAVLATGMHQCDPVAKADWISQADLTSKLEAEGWKVRRMKEDGGCWEVYGTMPDGKRVEGYFHPATGETLLLNQRGTIIFRAED